VKIYNRSIDLSEGGKLKNTPEKYIGRKGIDADTMEYLFGVLKRDNAGVDPIWDTRVCG